MMKPFFICTVFLFFLVFAAGCYSYTPPSPVLLGAKYTSANRAATDQILRETKKLSLMDAKHIAQLNNQNYLAAYHAVNAARMRYYQALGAYAPEIHLGSTVGQDMQWNSSRVNPPMTNAAGRDISFKVNSSVTASWLLFDGFARYLNVKAMQSEVRKQTAMQYKVLCMLRRAVAYAYYDIQMAQEVERIQRENIEFQNRFYQMVKPEWEQGKRPEDEVLNFSILSGLAQTGLIAAQYQGNAANYSLARLMGYSEGELPSEVEVHPFEDNIRQMYYSVEMCLDIALANSPEMHIMQQLLKIAEYNKYRSYSAYFPVVYAEAGYGSTQMRTQYKAFKDSHSSFSNNSLSYGVRADWLVFDGFARYNAMREMQTMFAVAQFNMAETYLQIINEIRSAYANYENNLKQVRIYRNLLKKAKKQRDLVAERYKKYHASVDRIDKVQAYYIDIQLQNAAVITDFNKSVAQLEAVMCIDIYARERE